jgi:hypothetical protein
MDDWKLTKNLVTPLMSLTAVTFASDLSDALKDPASIFSQITDDEQLAKLRDEDGVEYFNAHPGILQLNTLSTGRTTERHNLRGFPCQQFSAHFDSTMMALEGITALTRRIPIELNKSILLRNSCWDIR